MPLSDGLTTRLARVHKEARLCFAHVRSMPRANIDGVKLHSICTVTQGCTTTQQFVDYLFYKRYNL